MGSGSFPDQPDTGGKPGTIDLSTLDLEALAQRFATAARKNVELEQLRAAVRAQLDKLIRVNHTHADFLSKFEELIESYNAGSRSIDDLVTHVTNDPLVIWAWAPGKGRRPPPGTHGAFAALIRAWAATGAECPRVP